MTTPVTRWEQADHSHYAARFDELIADGTDIDGEARLVDVIAPRGATVLDAGSGLGRVAAALAARGHDVTGVEKDRALVERSRSAYPQVPVVVADLVELTSDLLERAGRPREYDVVVVVGNVMVLLAEQTEATVVANLAALLAPGGRMLVGFRMVGGPENASTYPEHAFLTHTEAAGLVLEHRFGGYDLTATDPDYGVWVLTRPA